MAKPQKPRFALPLSAFAAAQLVQRQSQNFGFAFAKHICSKQLVEAGCSAPKKLTDAPHRITISLMVNRNVGRAGRADGSQTDAEDSREQGRR